MPRAVGVEIFLHTFYRKYKNQVHKTLLREFNNSENFIFLKVRRFSCASECYSQVFDIFRGVPEMFHLLEFWATLFSGPGSKPNIHLLSSTNKRLIGKSVRQEGILRLNRRNYLTVPYFFYFYLLFFSFYIRKIYVYT